MFLTQTGRWHGHFEKIRGHFTLGKELWKEAVSLSHFSLPGNKWPSSIPPRSPTWNSVPLFLFRSCSSYLALDFPKLFWRSKEKFLKIPLPCARQVFHNLLALMSWKVNHESKSFENLVCVLEILYMRLKCFPVSLINLLVAMLLCINLM